MSTVVKTLEVLLPILLGLSFRLVGVFGDEEGDVIRSYVVRVCVPLLVFFSMYDSSPETVSALPVMMGAFVLVSVALFFVGWACSQSVSEPAGRTALHACVMLGNYGWLGFGVCQVLLGDPGFRRAVFFIVLWWPVFYGLGIPIGLIHLRGDRGKVPVKRALKVALPTIGMLVAGLAFNYGSVQLPGLVEDTLRPFARMTVPLILFSVGLILDVTKIHRRVMPALLVSGMALVVAPLIGWSVAALVARPDATSYQAIILESAMPVATMTPVLAESYEMDLDLVTTCIIVSTLLSMLSIPLVAMMVV
jgi:hypothetical protein